MQRDAEYITALVAGADKRAKSVVRSGGSNSARRLALDSMQAFGRTYGQLKLEQQKRRGQLGNYNESLKGETAAQMAQFANAIENYQTQMKYTSDSNLLKNQGFANQRAQVNANELIGMSAIKAQAALGVRQLQGTNQLNLARIAQRGQLAQSGYNQNIGNLLNEFNYLTVPSFGLARRQGERDFDALISNTLDTIKGASTPYREQIIFDPLQPIAGLRPEKGMITKAAKPGWGSIIANSFISGAQGAMSMSYTKGDGSLGFR